MERITPYLEYMLEHDASDIYFSADIAPVFRIQGSSIPKDEAPLTPEDTRALAESIMKPAQIEEFDREHEMNLAIALPGRARFRVNIFQQRGNVGMVLRVIKEDVPNLEALLLPQQVSDIALSKRGLALLVGATGSGKSTTLAAIIDHRNANTAGHIITVEDPVEFVHKHKKSVITQREVGFDTHSFAAALKNTLRQAPDVILIGEIRDTETMEAALTFAETGHLCLATLHSNNANQAIERIINFFPHERHEQIYLQLSMNLRAIVSQRLIKSVDGGRAAALEIMMDTPRVRDLIKNAEIDMIKEAMEQGVQEGCQTFDLALMRLYLEGRIELEQALAHADSANNLRLRIRNEELKLGRAEEVAEEDKPSFTIASSDPKAPPWKK